MCSRTRAGRTLLTLGVVGLMIASLPTLAGARGRDEHGQGHHGHPGGHPGHHGNHWRPWHGWGFGSWYGWHRQRFCDRLEAVAQLPLPKGKAAGVVFLTDLFGCETPPEPEPDPQEPPATEAPPPDATILDRTGVAFAEVGSVDLDDGLFEVPVSSFADPVVLVGPPTGRDADPGVVEVVRVDADGFRVRFAEWSYLDGAHGTETVSYLVLAPGRYVLDDNSVWEVGSLELTDAGVFEPVIFSAPFSVPPQVFLSVQGAGDDDPVVARARAATEDGFEAAVFEEEGADGTRGATRVGYLALVSASGSGRVATTTGSLPYLVREVDASDQQTPVLSTALWLEEEASIDAELTHADETVAFLALGMKVFAQDVTSSDLDTAAVRRHAPEYGPVLEWGTVPDVDGAWHTVPLAREYTNPVVVAGPMSMVEFHPGALRVRNVGTDSFELRVQEWSYLNQAHAPERAFYMVADPGIQSLGGLMLEAGHLQTNLLIHDGMVGVGLALPFPTVPGVFSSVMTENDSRPVGVRVDARTETGFDVALQHEEANAAVPHGAETLGWIAIQSGNGVTTDGRRVEVFDVSTDHTPIVVPFSETMRGRFPWILAQIVTTMGLDTSEVRYVDLDPDAVSLLVEEEQSVDAEVGHRIEDISVFVAE